MKKTEFQKFAYSEMSKTFLKLYMRGKVKKYSSEAKYDRQKIQYEPEYPRSVAIYFYRSGEIRIYQRGCFGDSVESLYYKWQESSDYKDVISALTKDIAEFVNRMLRTPWGHDCFCDFSYSTSKFRKLPLAPEPAEPHGEDYGG